MRQARRIAGLVVTLAAVASPALPQTNTQHTSEMPSSDAAADTDIDDAKVLYAQAQTRLDAGDLEAALALYQKSRAKLPSVYNVRGEAYCLYRLARYDEALIAYRELASSFAKALDEHERTALEQRLRELRMLTAQIEIRTRARGTLTIDGRNRAELPLAEPLPILPGRHVIAVRSAGAKVERTFEARAGQVVTLDVPAPREPARVSRSMPNPRARHARPPERQAEHAASGTQALTVTGWALVGAGATGLAISGFFGWHALSNKESSDAALVDGRCNDRCFNAWQDAQSDARIANAAVLAGAALLGAGVYILLSSPARDNAGRAQAVLRVGVAPGQPLPRAELRSEF